MHTLWQDLRYGIRMLLKQPGFTVIAILTLALGIGANSAIFSVVNGVLLRPLPFREPDQLIRIYETFLPSGRGTASVPNLKDWREQNDVFTHIAAYQFGNFSLQGQEHPERVPGATVSPGFFDVVGVSPRLGRTFQEGEDQLGNHRVVILSDHLWQRNFAADPNIVGQDISLGGENFTVVGIMPPGYRFPSARSTELWVPLTYTDAQATRGNHFLFTLGRLKPGVTLALAQEQMSEIARRIEQQYPDEQAGRNVFLIPLQEEIVQNIRPALLVLLGAVAFVLLIACANVANLLLARATGRRKEIAIRTALGAGRARLIRQFLTESVLLSVLGGSLGLLLAYWGVDALVAFAGNFLPRAGEVGLDGRVVGFTLALALLTGILFGLAPALQVSRTDIQESLKDGARSGESPRHQLRSLLVVTETALALMLLIGAGLLIKSFLRLQQTDAGMRPENVLTLRVSLPDAKYKTPQAAVHFHQQVLDRVAALPGVQSAGVINLLPLQQWGFNGGIEIEGQGPYPPGQAPLAEFRAASPDYFRALGIPLMAGRFFNAQDHEKAAPVVVINQALARQYMPNQNPLGKRIRGGGSDWATVVGVVGDVKQSGLTQLARPETYIPYGQARYPIMTQSMSLVVRATSDPTKLAPAIRGEVLAVDPAQPVYNVQTMETVIADSVSDRRLNMLLLGIFAAAAVILAMLGIYSVMSYTVTQNTREIGIRMALGAQRRDVLKLVVGQGFMLTSLGVVIGVAGAFGLTRLMASLLYGVTATDPATFAGVSALLVVVALLACYLPARRAAKVDPMVALRYE